MPYLKWPQTSPGPTSLGPNSRPATLNQILTPIPILYVFPFVSTTPFNIPSQERTSAAADRPTSSIPGPFTADSFGPVHEQDLHPSSPGSSDAPNHHSGL